MSRSRPRPIPLLEEERALLSEFFLGGLDLSRLTLQEGGLASLGSTRSIFGVISFEPRLDFRRLRSSPFGRSLLVHEAVHVWQHQRVGPRYALGSAWDQLRATLRTGSRRGAYLYELRPERPLLSYGYEQQAQLLQDYYLRRWHGDEAYSRLHARDFDHLGRAEADRIAEQRRQELRAEV